MMVLHFMRLCWCFDYHDVLMFSILWSYGLKMICHWRKDESTRLLNNSEKFLFNAFIISLFFFLFPHRLGTINQIQCLCVLESDFGFSLNCNFKNSGLFRVRNLGGLKAHFGLGKEKKNLSNKTINQTLL